MRQIHINLKYLQSANEGVVDLTMNHPNLPLSIKMCTQMLIWEPVLVVTREEIKSSHKTADMIKSGCNTDNDTTGNNITSKDTNVNDSTATATIVKDTTGKNTSGEDTAE